MNKERVIKLISLVNIGAFIGFGAVALYFSFTLELEDFLKGFLQGIGIVTILVGPFIFSKYGPVQKMMRSFDERQFVIHILTMYIMTLLLLFVVSRLFMQYITTSEISFIQLNIKLLVLIIAKLAIKRNLDKYL